MSFYLCIAFLGAMAGFVAGLLGVGGGLFLVPLLALLFEAHGIDRSQVVHLALGTAMGNILFTSISSARAHHAHGAVNWAAVRAMVPGILLGTFISILFATRLPTRPLTILFVVIALAAAVQMIVNYRPKAEAERRLPGASALFAAGAVIGSVSSLVSAGGGFLTVPFLLYNNESMHRAVGTSAANGFPIALAGVAGYLISGLHLPDLPPHSLGYLYLPALVILVPLSMLCAPLGARLAHRLPVLYLRRIFALLLIALALTMAWRLLK